MGDRYGQRSAAFPVPPASRQGRQPVALCFSGGKDSTLALREIQRQASYAVVELLTTVTTEYERVSMHGVRRALSRASLKTVTPVAGSQLALRGVR